MQDGMQLVMLCCDGGIDWDVRWGVMYDINCKVVGTLDFVYWGVVLG